MSSQYKIIGSLEGYKKLVNEGKIPNFGQLHKKITLKNYKGIKKMSLLRKFTGKEVEQIICDYIFNKNKTEVTNRIKEIIYGCNLKAFVNTLDEINNDCILHLKQRNVRIGKKLEIDILYKNTIIDVKAYKNNFTYSMMISTFVQLYEYYKHIKDKISIKYLMIFVPTKNDIYYCPVPDSIEEMKKKLIEYEERPKIGFCCF